MLNGHSNISKTDPVGACSAADQLTSKGLVVTQQLAFRNGPQVPQKCAKLAPPQLSPPMGSALQLQREHLPKEGVSRGVPRIVQLPVLFKRRVLFGFRQECFLSLQASPVLLFQRCLYWVLRWMLRSRPCVDLTHL